MCFALSVLRPSFAKGDIPGANPQVLNNLGLLETVRLMDGTEFQRHLASSHPTDKTGLRKAAAEMEIRVVGDRLVQVPRSAQPTDIEAGPSTAV